MAVQRTPRHLITASNNGPLGLNTLYFTAKPGALLIITIASRINGTTPPSAPSYVRLDNGILAVQAIDVIDTAGTGVVLSRGGVYLLQYPPWFNTGQHRVEVAFTLAQKNQVQVFEIDSGSVFVGLTGFDAVSQSPEALVTGNYHVDAAVFASGAFCGTNLIAAPATELAAPNNFWLTANAELTTTDLYNGLWYSAVQPKRAKWTTFSNSSNQGHIIEVRPGGAFCGNLARSARMTGKKGGFAADRAERAFSVVEAGRKADGAAVRGEGPRTNLPTFRKGIPGVAHGEVVRSAAALGRQGHLGAFAASQARDAIVDTLEQVIGAFAASQVGSGVETAGIAARAGAAQGGQARSSEVETGAMAMAGSARGEAVGSGVETPGPSGRVSDETAGLARSSIVGYGGSTRAGGGAGAASVSATMLPLPKAVVGDFAAELRRDAVAAGRMAHSVAIPAEAAADAIEQLGASSRIAALAAEQARSGTVAAIRVADGASAGAQAPDGLLSGGKGQLAADRFEVQGSGEQLAPPTIGKAAAVAAERQASGAVSGSRTALGTVVAERQASAAAGTRKGMASHATGSIFRDAHPRGGKGQLGAFRSSAFRSGTEREGIPTRIGALAVESRFSAMVRKMPRIGMAPIELKGSLTEIMLKGKLETTPVGPRPRRLYP